MEQCRSKHTPFWQHTPIPEIPSVLEVMKYRGLQRLSALGWGISRWAELRSFRSAPEVPVQVLPDGRGLAVLRLPDHNLDCPAFVSTSLVAVCCWVF